MILTYIGHQKASEVLLKRLTDHLGGREERERGREGRERGREEKREEGIKGGGERGREGERREGGIKGRR